MTKLQILMFDKLKIKSNFNKAHKTYNQAAILQKMVAKKLVTLAQKDFVSADKILDLGSGTGFIADAVLFNFKNPKIFQLDIANQMLINNPFDTPKIVADIEALPFRENIFDLALSSLSFQWLNDLKNSISQILKILTSNGSFYFSIIADGSLQELKKTQKQCNTNLSINQFNSVTELKQILSDLKVNYQIKSETIVLEYQNFYALLKSIKSIGASYSKNKTYLSRKQFGDMNSFYLNNFNLDNKVFASWQVVFVTIKIS